MSRINCCNYLLTPFLSQKVECFVEKKIFLVGVCLPFVGFCEWMFEASISLFCWVGWGDTHKIRREY